MDTPPDTTRKRRRYTDAEQAEALAVLAATGGNIAATAATTGIPDSTLEHWARGDRRPMPIQLGEEKKAALAARLDRLAGKMLRQANRRVKDMNGRDAVIGAAVCIDKALLVRSGTTAAAPESDARLELFRKHFGQAQVIAQELHLHVHLPGPTAQPTPTPIDVTPTAETTGNAGESGAGSG